MAGVRVTIYHDQLPGLVREATVEQRTEIAHQVARTAIASAPVLHGDYRGGIGVDVDGASVRVVDNDDDAGYKEYGTSDTPAHATLTNAARAYGRYSGYQPRR